MSETCAAERPNDLDTECLRPSPTLRVSTIFRNTCTGTQTFICDESTSPRAILIVIVLLRVATTPFISVWFSLVDLAHVPHDLEHTIAHINPQLGVRLHNVLQLILLRDLREKEEPHEQNAKYPSKRASEGLTAVFL